MGANAKFRSRIALTSTIAALLLAQATGAAAAETEPPWDRPASQDWDPGVSTESIGLAKALLDSAPLGDGNVWAKMRFVVRNYGSEPLTDVRVYQDFVWTFGNHSVVASLTTRDDCELATFEPNVPIDRVVSLLATGNVLAPGEQCTIDLTVAFPTADLDGEEFSHSSVATATDATGHVVTDMSTDGHNPDANGNGDPSDDAEETPYAIRDHPLAEGGATSISADRVRFQMIREGISSSRDQNSAHPVVWLALVAGVFILISVGGVAVRERAASD